MEVPGAWRLNLAGMRDLAEPVGDVPGLPRRSDALARESGEQVLCGCGAHTPEESVAGCGSVEVGEPPFVMFGRGWAN
jgi:hypothetical protein